MGFVDSQFQFLPLGPVSCGSHQVQGCCVFSHDAALKDSAVPGSDSTKVPKADCELAQGEGRDGSKRSTG